MKHRQSPDGFMLSMAWPKASNRDGKGTEQGFLRLRRLDYPGGHKLKWPAISEKRSETLQFIDERRDETCDSAAEIYCRLFPWTAAEMVEQILSGQWRQYLAADEITALEGGEQALLAYYGDRKDIRRNYGKAVLTLPEYTTLCQLCNAIESRVIDHLSPREAGTFRHLIDRVYSVFADSDEEDT